MSTPSEAISRTLFVALAGNPNSGKTSVFNALTGLRRRVGNYPGVTVERVEGQVRLPDGAEARVIDLPGCYSLVARSDDERVARDVLLGLEQGAGRPDLAVVVIDASNLERNLYFFTQIAETGLPLVVALNMVDVAERASRPVDAEALEGELGVPVVPVVGRTGRNIEALKLALSRARPGTRRWHLAGRGEDVLATVRAAVAAAGIVPVSAEEGEAIRLLHHAREDDPYLARGGAALAAALRDARSALEEDQVDRVAAEATGRYAFCAAVAKRVVRAGAGAGPSLTERIDRLATHRLLGPILYVALMGLIFLGVYSWAEPVMNAIGAAQGWLQREVGALLGPGMLTDLLVDGVLAGVGTVLQFLPQICILFLFLTVLEDLGYLARAAFIVDRLMRSVGLHGKAFIPLMSSFACAVPGIMATRTIESRRDRLVTILVAPLMSCSARLPVYALMIGAFIPPGYRSLTLLSMYLLSVVAAFTAAWVLRATLFRGQSGTFLLELPPYKLPRPRQVALSVWSRGALFVRQAGTVILAISIVLWFLAYFPRSAEIRTAAQARIDRGEEPGAVRKWEASAQVRQSIAGRVGRFIEPAIAPLGFDWKMGIGILGAFAAREFLVSSLGIVYGVGDVTDDDTALQEKLRMERLPDGRPAFTALTAISLMVFFVLACQCMSTLAVVKRETNSWRWPLFMMGYMTVLAWLGSLVVYQGGLLLGFGS